MNDSNKHSQQANTELPNPADPQHTTIDLAADDSKRVGDVDPYEPVPLPPLDASPLGPATNNTRYRVLRPHAKGGLGEVFVAQDCELNREVAL